MKTYLARYDDGSVMTIEAIRFLRPGFLESFLEYLDKKLIDGKPVYVNNLLELLGKADGTNINDAVLDKYLADCPKLSEYKSVARTLIAKRLSLAGIKDCPEPTEKITFTSKKYLSGVFVVNYFIVKALTSIMSKTDAIKFFQEFTES